MLLAYGFLRRVFEVFERYKTSIDMITTSEVGVSLTIDDTTHTWARY
jgi:aspartate kinase